MYLANSPFWLQWFYPMLTWHKSRQKKCLYLTFDDGPVPIVTDFVLKTLNKHQAKATFFCIGDNVEKHPETFQKIIQEGHSVGNHTQNHLKGWDYPDEIYLDNIKKCSNLIKTNLFRPPYGRAKRSQYSILKNQYTIIMWDVLSGDFDTTITAEKCLNNVLKHAKNGSIIVFHDSLKAWSRLEYALPKALDIWVAQGYEFKGL